MFIPRNASRAKGFSLVEILLVIGIIIALAIAAFVLYPRVKASQEASQESQNITAIQAGVKQAFTNGLYDGLTTAIANQARIFPSSMNGGNNGTGATIRNTWTGTVTVEDPTPGTVGDRRFYIEYQGVPTEVCVRLVNGVGRNFDTVNVNAVQVKAPNVTVDQAAAATNCGTSATATVRFFSL